MQYRDLSSDELLQLEQKLTAEYQAWQSKKLKLDMSRGKPGATQLNLCNDLLKTIDVYKAANGTDSRNYGVLEGLPETREFFGQLLELDPNRIIVGGNSSLNLMYDMIMRLYCFGLGGHKPWKDYPEIKFLCPVPGYDRHFAVTQEFGFKLVNIPTNENGPDMDLVEKLVAEDPSIKGIWCVPLYSNPGGTCYSEKTVERLASMKTAAPDFKIFWDNAYGIHHLYEETPLADIFQYAEKSGNPNRVLYFFSTSKITFPGAGVSIMATGYDDFKEIVKHLGIQIISYDKINQLRTLQFLKSPQHTQELMKRHAEFLVPKFEAVEKVLSEKLGGLGIATWSKPRGGYFVSLDTLPGCATATVKLAAEAGVKLTGAGATFPYKKDPNDSNIRIAPSYPELSELELALDLFTICLKLATVRHLLNH